MAGESGIAFEKQLRKAFETDWQPSRKLPKKGRLHTIEKQLTDVRAAADSARSALNEATQCGSAAEALRQEIARLVAEAGTVESQLRTVSGQAEERDRLARNVAESLREHQSQDKLFQELWRRSESIRTESERRGQLVAATPGLIATLEERRGLERLASERAADADRRRWPHPNPIRRFRPRFTRRSARRSGRTGPLNSPASDKS